MKRCRISYPACTSLPPNLQLIADALSSLEALAEQTENTLFANIIGQLATDISGGMRFSQALAKYPIVFSSVYVNLIAASELGGFMAEVLKELVSLEEKRAELRSTIGSALTYPVFLIVFSVVVVIFVLTVVFPKFADLFASIADQLPASKFLLMAVSDLLRQHWLAITIACAGMAAAAYYRLQQPAGRAWLDKAKLTTPVVRDIVAQIYLVQMMRVMSLSLKKDVSVTGYFSVVSVTRQQPAVSRIRRKRSAGRQLRQRYFSEL